jgi:perosamine synthetase
MVVTNDEAIADKVKLLKNHGMDPNRRYWHPVVGYNYRMTNVAAAIGLAQVEKVDEQIAGRREVASKYRKRLREAEGVSWQAEETWAKHVWWMFSVLLDESLRPDRDNLIEALAARGIETRPIVHPLHTLPPYAAAWRGEDFPVAERIARRGLNLPTWVGLSEEQIARTCSELCAAAGATKRTCAPTRG